MGCSRLFFWKRLSVTAFVVLCVLLGGGLGFGVMTEAVAAPDQPFAGFTRGWRDDAAWYDGRAECCVYDATRVIYGKARHYRARLYTNKELADPQTKTKSATGQGREVFKHHLREDIPTENYTYHYSTMCYVGTDDLKSLKLDMGSQEDCGASFKQVVNHAGKLGWVSHVYFPGAGSDSGVYRPAEGLAFQDALSLILRGYPFEAPRDIRLRLIPDQTSTKQTGTTPVEAVVRYMGREAVDLPVGLVEAHHVRVEGAAGSGGSAGVHDYWFDVDGSPPRLHVMVRYEGADGTTYRLREIERRAYWERPSGAGVD